LAGAAAGLQKFGEAAKFLLPNGGEVAIIVFVAMEIMNASFSRFSNIGSLACSFLLISSSALVANELVLQKVPPLTVEQAPAYPENLARYHFGAQVEADGKPASGLQLSSKNEDRNTSEVALLCDDPTTGYALSSGTKTLVITLSKIENIDNISFLNHGVKGDVTIATSNSKVPTSSSEWRVVSEQKLTADAVHAKVGPSEAKYVKLTFNVTEPGRIAALGVYSTPNVAAFTMPRARKQSLEQSDSFALISYNLTDVHAKSRALYVSSGNEIREANNMIDDQPATTYKFASADSEPTAIIDLGKVTTLRRITALYTPRPGNVDFYVLSSLPGHQPNGSKTLKLDEAALANLKAVGSVSDGTGRAAIDFPETTGRYILVKWAGAADSDAPFSVAEIAAFGGSRPGNLIAANTSAVTQDRMESDGKSGPEGKDMGSGKDFSKDMPEEGPESPAEGPPPSLPDPPPFTFVPEILPTSP
jgi:hypothetical protein